MMLAEACAYCADLLHLPATPDDDARALEALARWLVRFSPRVSPCLPHCIFLDVTGMERLFGGPAAVRQLVADALVAFGISAWIAVAPTPGAAWAIATFGRGSPPVVHDRDQMLQAVASLPPEALRLDGNVTVMLRRLGIDTMAALLRLPRNQLATRFDSIVLRRIDQLTGDVTEPLVFLEHQTPLRAAMQFEGAMENLETIHAAIQHLLKEVTAELTRRGQGARQLRVTLPRPYASPIERMIHLTRPARSVSGLLELIRFALEGVRADDRGDGFMGVRIDVVRSEPFIEEQSMLLGAEEKHAATEQAHLIERLHARFDGCMEWPALVESRMPERAMTCASVPSPQTCPPRRGARPTRLLREPQSLRVIVMPSEGLDGLPVSMTHANQVHRLPRARGPERIVGQWWDGRWKTRDYFDAEDETGRRYWLFRVVETGRWFLHGMFE